jgi:membrane-bound lytic murein transglycosylase D
MGGHLLRGKALKPLGRLAAAALLLSALGAGVHAAALSSPDTSSSLPPAGAAPDGQDGPLPPLQGHEAPEVFSIAIPDEDLIGRYVDGLLATRRQWLQQCLERSARYRVVISRALEEKGLPGELAFLPAIESGFQERAVSPRGAAGLWQLMRNTASPYGLRMDLWLDERRDVEKATDASLAKLVENYSIYGDWYLALAAYNCGVGKLSSILRRNSGSDYWALRKKGVLPRETAAFVPQFLAAARILGHAGRYGLDLGWDPPPQWSVIALDRCVDLRILSRATGAPLDSLLAGNPALNFLVTPPATYEYKLKVPADFGDAVEAALAGPQVPLLEFRVHVVAVGDTLFGMSLLYKVSVPMIQEFNPSVNPRALRIGAKVLIPVIPPRSSG